MRDYSLKTFTVEGRELVMHAAPAYGRPYRHTCPLASLEAVAHALDECPEGMTSRQLRDSTGLAWSRIGVAINFLDERSIIERRGKRGKLCVPTTQAVHLDAMTEYHALREGGAA